MSFTPNSPLFKAVWKKISTNDFQVSLHLIVDIWSWFGGSAVFFFVCRWFQLVDFCGFPEVVVRRNVYPPPPPRLLLRIETSNNYQQQILCPITGAEVCSRASRCDELCTHVLHLPWGGGGGSTCYRIYCETPAPDGIARLCLHIDAQLSSRQQKQHHTHFSAESGKIHTNKQTSWFIY